MRLISLASGTLPEFDPVTVIESAAAGGFSGCGVWYEAKTWSAATSAAVRAAFERTGLRPLEMEVLVLGEPERADNALALLDAAAEVGINDVLVVSRDSDPGRNLEAFAQLADEAEARSLYLNLEFLPIFGIRDLPAALAVIDGVGSDNLKLLIDTLHVARTGLDIGDIAWLPADCFRFAQFCDAWQTPPHDGSFEALYDEALNGRLLPGEGDLPLADILAVLPSGLPLSVELRSRQLRAAYPDPVARARTVYESTSAWLEDPNQHG